MENLNNSSYHSEWQNNRINFMLSLYDPSFFENKTILELGSFNGYIGAYFAHNFNCKVTSVEGRMENVLHMQSTYPQITSIQSNLDTEEWNFDQYDIIINFGLFYHLENFHEQHLTNCIKNCKTMFFETVVYDSFDSEIYYVHSNGGGDQTLGSSDGNPSTSYVENIFKKNNSKFIKYTDSRLNSGSHNYSWEDLNSKVYNGFNRRFWVAE
jgi:hypothetical protein